MIAYSLYFIGDQLGYLRKKNKTIACWML